MTNDKLVTLRASSPQYELWKKAAARSHLDFSRWARRLLDAEAARLLAPSRPRRQTQPSRARRTPERAAPATVTSLDAARTRRRLEKPSGGSTGAA